MTTYTTMLGDAWDLIAFKVYGDEKYMKFLIEANPALADTLIFDSGITLLVPELPEEQSADLPFWRR